MQRERDTRTERDEDQGRLRALRQHLVRFGEVFGDAGAAVRAFFSPGRINLMGAHLDYNGGPVMPAAIDRGTFLATRERSDMRAVLASTIDGASVEIELTALPRERAGRWADYPLGVLVEMHAL